MKTRIMALLLAVLIVLSLAACTITVKPNEPEPDKKTDKDTTKPNLNPGQEPDPEPEPASEPEPGPKPAPEPIPEPAEARELTPEELAALNESFTYDIGGFFVCTFERPEEIDWNEVLYNGAGISLGELPQDVQERYENQYGEIFTDVVAVKSEDLESFVLSKTGLPYEYARKKLMWYLDYESGIYVFQHGDTNLIPIQFTGGTVAGDTYTLYYQGIDVDHHYSEKPYAMTAMIRDGDWRFISNLPADGTASKTLLNISFYETREAAESEVPETFYETEFLDSEEPSGICWAVITAQEDNVRFIVDRAVWDNDLEYYLATLYGFNLPTENLTSGVLNKGESAAILVNNPWYPTIRLSASVENYFGEYWFGESGVQHVPLEAGAYVIGSISNPEPADEAELVDFLEDGMWIYCDGDTGEALAAVQFKDYRTMQIITEESTVPFYLNYDRYMAEEDETPDIIALAARGYTEDDSVWDCLPKGFGSKNMGDYAISILQLDGEQLLRLSQANNGDGALSYVFPGGEGKYSFTLIRFKGAEIFENQG